MDDIESMYILNASYNLLKDGAGLLLGHSRSTIFYFLHLTI